MARRKEMYMAYLTQASADEIEEAFDDCESNHRGASMRKTRTDQGDKSAVRDKWLDRMHGLMMQMEDLRDET